MTGGFKSGPTLQEVTKALFKPATEENALSFTQQGWDRPSHKLLIEGVDRSDEGYELKGKIIFLSEPPVPSSISRIWAIWNTDGSFVRGYHAPLQLRA